jgi:hypothetical protein
MKGDALHSLPHAIIPYPGNGKEGT